MDILKKRLFVPIFQHLVEYPSPINLNYFWSFGSLSGIFLVFQILTGIFLAMHYSANIQVAFASLEHILRDVQYGWFLRSLHANGASFMFIVVYIHISRALFCSSYLYPREFLWFSGVSIFFLMMGTAFIGYVLPWGQMSFWGATVITNLASAIPVIGKQIVLWLWGGFSVNNATLNRFFSLHYILPLVIFCIMIIHILLLHDKGSTNPLGAESVKYVPFFPYFWIKDSFGFFCILQVFLFIVFFNADFFSHPDNYIEADSMVTPPHIVPEWYFLPYYAILRSVPDKLFGVFAMLGSIFIFYLLPFYLKQYYLLNTIKVYFYRPLHKLGLIGFFSVVFLLGWMGTCPPEYPFIKIGQILSFFYFFYFFALLPKLSILESQSLFFYHKVKKNKIGFLKYLQGNNHVNVLRIWGISRLWKKKKEPEVKKELELFVGEPYWDGTLYNQFEQYWRELLVNIGNRLYPFKNKIKEFDTVFIDNFDDLLRWLITLLRHVISMFHGGFRVKYTEIHNLMYGYSSYAKIFDVDRWLWKFWHFWKMKFQRKKYASKEPWYDALNDKIRKAGEAYDKKVEFAEDDYSAWYKAMVEFPYNKFFYNNISLNEMDYWGDMRNHIVAYKKNLYTGYLEIWFYFINKFPYFKIEYGDYWYLKYDLFGYIYNEFFNHRYFMGDIGQGAVVNGWLNKYWHDVWWYYKFWPMAIQFYSETLWPVFIYPYFFVCEAFHMWFKYGFYSYFIGFLCVIQIIRLILSIYRSTQGLVPDHDIEFNIKRWCGSIFLWLPLGIILASLQGLKNFISFFNFLWSNYYFNLYYYYCDYITEQKRLKQETSFILEKYEKYLKTVIHFDYDICIQTAQKAASEAIILRRKDRKRKRAFNTAFKKFNLKMEKVRKHTAKSLRKLRKESYGCSTIEQYKKLAYGLSDYRHFDHSGRELFNKKRLFNEIHLDDDEVLERITEQMFLALGFKPRKFKPMDVQDFFKSKKKKSFHLKNYYDPFEYFKYLKFYPKLKGFGFRFVVERPPVYPKYMPLDFYWKLGIYGLDLKRLHRRLVEEYLTTYLRDHIYKDFDDFRVSQYEFLDIERRMVVKGEWLVEKSGFVAARPYDEEIMDEMHEEEWEDDQDEHVGESFIDMMTYLANAPSFLEKNEKVFLEHSLNNYNDYLKKAEEDRKKNIYLNAVEHVFSSLYEKIVYVLQVIAKLLLQYLKNFVNRIKKLFD